MLLKNIVIGLLLNTITLTQASTELADKEAAERTLYLEHYQTKERMIKLYDSLNIGKDKAMTPEQQEKMKPITKAFGDLDKKVKALAKLREEQEAKDKELVAKAPETSVGLPKEIPQAEPEIAKVSPPSVAAPVSKSVVSAPAKDKVVDTPKIIGVSKVDIEKVEKTAQVVAPATEPLPVEKVAESVVAQPHISKVVQEKPKVETKPEAAEASKPEEVTVPIDIKTEEKEKTNVPPKEEKNDTAESIADSTKTTEKSTQEETDKENKEQTSEPIEADAESEAKKPAQGGGILSGIYETFLGPSKANEEEDQFDEENNYDYEEKETDAIAGGELVQKNKAEEKSELESTPKQTATVEKSKILDGQLEASKDSQQKREKAQKDHDDFWGNEEKEGTASKDVKAAKVAPSEIKSEQSESVKEQSENDIVTESITTGEAPKEKADKKDSTLATGSATASLDEVSEASPDLTIAFLILLGLGISVFYNQSQQDQGAAQYNYKETNTLAAKKGDEASLFSSWHADPNIGNRQRSHNLLQVQDEEINF